MAAVLLLAVPVMAQTTTDNIKVIERNNGVTLRYDVITMDSAGVKYSQALDLTHYDNTSIATNPIAFSYRIAKFTANDSVNVSVEVWGTDLDPTVNANWKVIDTLVTVAVLKATSTPVVAQGTFNLNNVKKAYTKIKIRNNGTGSKRHYLSLGVYYYLRD